MKKLHETQSPIQHGEMLRTGQQVSFLHLLLSLDVDSLNAVAGGIACLMSLLFLLLSVLLRIAEQM